MKVQKTQNNINFGLNYNTHRKIAQKLIEEEYPNLQKYVPIIKTAVEIPDFSELGFYCNTHFYYPIDSYIKPRESYLDFDGLHNARSKYNEHVNKFIDYAKEYSFVDMAEEAGRAKHFLDDMSVGFHSQRGNWIQKLREKKLHKYFEDYIYNNEDELIKNAKKSPVEFKTDNFDDIFMSVVNYSKNTELPTNNNLNRWHEIAQNTINIAIDSSREFFNKISEYLL